MEGGIGSVILGFILWRMTGNILIGAIGAVILWPIFSAILGPIKRSVQMLGVKTPPFYTLMEPARGDPDTVGRGARVLLMTGPEINALPESERLKAYEALYADGVAKFFDKDAFQRCILALESSGLPLRVCASVCRVGHTPSMTKCFSLWYKMLAAEPFELGEDEKDTFIEDLIFSLPGQSGELRAGIGFFFAKHMSVGESAAGEAAMPPCPVFHEGIREIAAKG